jgi:tetratricopeptide (TPR) repeat protein
LPASWSERAASGARGDGSVVPGKWHIYPEMAAAGLWTTPADLAKWGIEIALSKQGKANHILSEAMTRQMLTPQSEQVGLGPFLKQGGNPEAFGHDGDDGWNYTSQPGAVDVLQLVVNARDAATAIRKYEEMKQSSPKQLDENVLLHIAYRLLFSGRSDEAIQVFKLQVQDHPDYWNSYDSIGEAYMRTGQKDLAILNYEKSIELKPDNQNGIDMLKKLRGQ